MRSGIDLATRVRDDHSVLAARFLNLIDVYFQNSDETTVEKLAKHAAPKRYTKLSLCAPARRATFSSLLPQFHPEPFV